jgi:hypothetical protein
LDNIVEINRTQVFSYEQALVMLPIVYRVTRASSQEVQGLIDRLDHIDAKDETAVRGAEEKINAVIAKWQTKIEKLGAKPKGLWIADFDFGEGYYCWKYPETKLEYWHAYTDGFSGRCLIEKPRLHAET